MIQVDDLSRSLIAFEQISTLVIVVELSQSSWLAAGVVPGIERRPLKKLDPDPTARAAWRALARCWACSDQQRPDTSSSRLVEQMYDALCARDYEDMLLEQEHADRLLELERDPTLAEAPPPAPRDPHGAARRARCAARWAAVAGGSSGKAQLLDQDPQRLRRCGDVALRRHRSGRQAPAAHVHRCRSRRAHCQSNAQG